MKIKLKKKNLRMKIDIDLILYINRFLKINLKDYQIFKKCRKVKLIVMSNGNFK